MYKIAHLVFDTKIRSLWKQQYHVEVTCSWSLRVSQTLTVRTNAREFPGWLHAHFLWVRIPADFDRQRWRQWKLGSLKRKHKQNMEEVGRKEFSWSYKLSVYKSWDGMITTSRYVDLVRKYNFITSHIQHESYSLLDTGCPCLGDVRSQVLSKSSYGIWSPHTLLHSNGRCLKSTRVTNRA